MNCLSPSILSADPLRLAEEVRIIDEAGAQYVHIDIMDGSFVPNITLGLPVVGALRSITDKILDVHLMVEEPVRFIPQVAKDGADIITVHAEACKHLDYTLTEIKKAGVMAGVALCPATPLSAVENVLSMVDMVLIMSVNPGFGGQKLIPYTIDKVRALRKMIDRVNPEIDLEIDGGVNEENLDMILDAGANIIVAGSAIFGDDTEDNTRAFLDRMME